MQEGKAAESESLLWPALQQVHKTVGKQSSQILVQLKAKHVKIAKDQHQNSTDKPRPLSSLELLFCTGHNGRYPVAENRDKPT